MKKSIIVFTLLLYSCQHNEYDFNAAGEEYCTCMKEQNSASKNYLKNYLVASDSCDKKIAKRYYWFRFYRFRTREQYDAATETHLDSANKFVFGFLDYTNEHCCKETLNCN